MRATNEVVVTLSADLCRELHRRAASLDVPVEWLAAGLVCDTIEGLARGAFARPTPMPASTVA